MRFLAQVRSQCLRAQPELGKVVAWKGNEVAL
jgi:hypothetical protein